MTTYRDSLPQLERGPFLTDGGLETTLVFHQGLDLPCFAAFPLIRDAAGRQTLRRYFEPYLDTAREWDLGFVLDTPTWRANPDWGAKLGYSDLELAAVNRVSVAWARDLRDEFVTTTTPIVIDGVIGPRGDGYRADQRMDADQARRYHEAQIAVFRDPDADMVTAMTITYAEEAIGIALAAGEHGMPAVISFTVETDGSLPSGEPLGDAIDRVDAATGSSPAYYMINCAHPTHFAEVVAKGGAWTSRLRGIRANASAKSHAELDAAEDLDSGDPADLARRYRALLGGLERLAVLGGCCGTDHRHIQAIRDACVNPAAGNAPS
ncbi:MAG: homocysteine S-methyltransferase family protein [Alphaproteobacteria bacterium]|nr:homocysteine S-methyltransferase family protein [Alphaproteobacteria bacterium]